MNDMLIPPIKCQGIKTKLVPDIKYISQQIHYERWIEPFMGSGVVGFNIRPEKALFADNNPHIIQFYKDIQSRKINQHIVKSYLQKEGKELLQSEGQHFYFIRDRFNKSPNSLDFLFLNRACFNGLIRFNNKGEFNVPFCHKPNRFSKAYITKIVNQIKNIQDLVIYKKYEFLCQSFDITIKEAEKNDLIYCDPPYIGRHVDYFNSWDGNQEILLYQTLKETKAKFILSTWHSNEYRTNIYLETLWNKFHVLTKEHFYHIGANEKNRNPITEALILNFPAKLIENKKTTDIQGSLFEAIPVLSIVSNINEINIC